MESKKEFPVDEYLEKALEIIRSDHEARQEDIEKLKELQELDRQADELMVEFDVAFAQYDKSLERVGKTPEERQEQDRLEAVYREKEAQLKKLDDLIKEKMKELAPTTDLKERLENLRKSVSAKHPNEN